MVPHAPYCVVVGGINVDLQGFSRASYVAGDSNPGTVTRAIGGVGRNISENLVRLGLHVELVTALGEGEEWSSLIRSTEDRGIGLGWSPRFPNLSLPTYLCILEPDGRLVGAVADMEAIDHLRVEHLVERRELFDAASAIVVDGNLPRASIEWIAETYGTGSHLATLSPETRPLLIADPVSGAKARKFAACFGQFDIAKPNATEAAIIAGLPPDADLGAVIASLAAHSNLPSELFMSLGERGIAVARSVDARRGTANAGGVATARGASLEQIPVEGVPMCPEARRPRAVNRSGSGDAACAALVWLSVAERRSGTFALCAREKAQFAIAAALFAASAQEPVNPRLTIENLCETARSCYPELAPLADAVRNGGRV